MPHHRLTRRPTRLVLAAGLLGVVSAAAACGGGSSTVAKRSTPTPRPTPTAAPTPAPPPPPPSSPAPVIIQVENLALARPQSGLNSADLVYEYETEGGITRFSLLFFHPPQTIVGPVRSARIATVRLLQIYGATLLYSGAGQFVEGQLNALRLRHYDEGAPYSFRVGGRVAPHNLYTDGGHVSALLTAIGPQSVPYVLPPRSTGPLPPGGFPAPQFTASISNYEAPSFVYDPAQGVYHRFETQTGEMTDAATGAAWSMSGVVVLHVPIVVAPQVHDVTGAFGLDHTLVGKGPAEVFVGGFGFHASFDQGPTGPPRLTLADGSPAPLPTGQLLVILQH